MLRDLRHDPFSLQSLIAWLETKPANEKYNYSDPRECMLCEYFRERLGCNVSVNAKTFTRYSGWHLGPEDLPPHFNEVSAGSHALAAWTFGDALRRARKLVRQHVA